LGERPSHASEHALGGAKAEMPIAYGRNARPSSSDCWRGSMSLPDHYVSSDERNWSVIAHLSALSALFIPFGHVLGPLAVWLIKRADMPMVD
jgi:hypothetical protein